MQTKSIGLEEKHEVAYTYVQMYYEHQYDRIAKLEDHRLTLTNIVITISVVAFTFGLSDKDLTIINGIGLPAIMIISNAFAIAYVLYTGDFIRIHQKRAKRVFEKYAQGLHQLDQSLPWPPKRVLGGQKEIQILIHSLLILAALLPVYTYLKKL